MRSPQEILRKKMLKKVAFPLLNGLLGEGQTHLYHYSPERDRLLPVKFGSQTYDYLRTHTLDADRWWDCVQRLTPGGSILDVGANAGYTSAWFANKADRVHAFEPHPSNAALLREHIRIRGLTNVEVHEAAVSDREGTVDLYCKPHAGHHSLADIGASATIGRLKVPCMTLDGFLRSEGIDDVRLLKIDTEGFEPEVLSGARDALGSGAIPRVLLEHSPAFYRDRGLDASAPLDFLSGLGFGLFTPDLEPLTTLEAGVQCDVIALARGVDWDAPPVS